MMEDVDLVGMEYIWRVSLRKIRINFALSFTLIKPGTFETNILSMVKVELKTFDFLKLKLLKILNLIIRMNFKRFQAFWLKKGI